MIDLGRPALHGESITVFFDHANPGRFYYFPDCPQLRCDAGGRPELSLLKYRLDPELHSALGAGLLSLTVDLGVEQERLDRIRRRIARQFSLNSQIALSPVSADTGTCELILIDQKTTTGDASSSPNRDGASSFGMVERILGSASPSLYGENACTFEAVLSPEGVGLIEGALLGGGLPVGVVYALQVTGLRPALRAQITARWKDIYNYYDNRLHGGKLLLAVDIGSTIEDLVHSEAIQIKIDELVPESERETTYQRALDQVQSYVLNQFFKPTLGQAPPPPDDSDGPLQTIGKTLKDIAGLFSITYSLRDVKRDELKTFAYELSVAQAEVFTLSPQGTFGVVLGAYAGGLASQFIVSVEPAASAEMKFDVGSAIDLAAEQIDHLEVSLNYGARQERLILDPSSPRKQVSFWYKPELGTEIQAGYDVEFRADGTGITSRLSAPPTPTAERVIRVNPRELYQRASLRVVARGLPFDRYPSAIVDLTASDPVSGWSGAQTVELTADLPESVFSVRIGCEARVLFQRRVRYLDPQGTELVLDWEDADPGILVIGDPAPEIVDVQILGSARFGTVVRRLVVELRPKSNPEKVTTMVLTADKPSGTWSWAAGAGGNRDYEYRVTVYTVNNEVRQGEWLTGPPGKLIVGEGIARLRQVEMIFIGQNLATLKWLGLKIRFSFEDPSSGLFAEDEFLVQDTSHSLKWSYPVADPSRQQYTYRIVAIKEDGSLQEAAPVTTSDLLIVKTLSA